MNPLLTSVVNEVIALTSRPDLLSVIKTAVRAATLRAHHSDYYWRDWEEFSLKFDVPDYFQKISIATLIPRYRSIRHIRKHDGTEAGDFFTPVSPEESLDSYKRNRTDVWYSAGDQLNIRSSNQVAYALMGAYLSPDVGEDTYNSWIATIYPFAIINDATRVVFKTIGYDEQASVYADLVKQDYEYLKINFIQQTGW